jgi:hypothetical protein
MHSPNIMTHREKVAYLLEDLKARGIDSRKAAPPIFKFLWALGLEIPPPLFLNQTVNWLVLMPITITGIAVLLMAFFFCGGMSWLLQIFYVVAILGLLVKSWQQAGVWAELGARLNLPPWQDYPAVPLEKADTTEVPRLPGAGDTSFRAK